MYSSHILAKILDPFWRALLFFPVHSRNIMVVLSSYAGDGHSSLELYVYAFGFWRLYQILQNIFIGGKNELSVHHEVIPLLHHIQISKRNKPVAHHQP